jgi:hypothetical protein
MCLIIDKNNLKPITAEQDIVCYKVLKKFPNRDTLKAPIYIFEYCFGMIYATHEDYFEDVDICDDGECLVEYGFHSFVCLEDAVNFKCLLNKTFNPGKKDYDYVVVKCTIPNGTRYYTGKQKFALNEDNSPDGYCSEAIRIDEIVNENAE